MQFADEYFVRAQGHVLHHTQDAVSRRSVEVDADLKRRVSSLTDEQVLALDNAVWSQQVAADLAIAPPVLDLESVHVVDEGTVEVDCAGVPGISYTSWERGGPVMRDGHRIRLVVPGTNLDLLASRVPQGGTGRRADVLSDRLERAYEWPQVRPSDELDADTTAVVEELQQGCEQIAEQVQKFNAQLENRARDLVDERRQKVLSARSFVGGLRLPVKRRDDAATRIPGLPKPKARPRAMTQSPPPTATPALDGPTLDEFYRHFLAIVGNALVGLERSPGRFANADEEVLRDQLLVTLNTHYDGHAHGESFNGAGKTDILIRHANNNVVIAECKWWGGKKVLTGALEQLISYTTWRDNRLALILFVGTKGIDAVIKTARAELEQREEFVRWTDTSRVDRLACQLHWDDGSRQAALTVFFAHLPAP